MQGSEVRAGLAFAVAVVVDDVFPLVGIGAGDDRLDRLGVAQVEHFVGHARLDENHGASMTILNDLTAPWVTWLPGNSLLLRAKLA